MRSLPFVVTAMFTCAPMLFVPPGCAAAAPSNGAEPVATRPAATQPAVTFLAGRAAADAFVDDRAEPYFGKLSPHEMTAKTGQPITGDTPDAMRQECVRRYRDGVRAFTDTEREMLGGHVRRVQPALARIAPRLGTTPWKFIKIANHIEGGLPHTRGDCIVLSEAVLQQFTMMRQIAPDMEHAAVGPLLVHEIAHVFQRANPELFAKLYEGRWGFRRAKSVEPNAWLTSRQLLNPDGVVCDWVLPVGDGPDRRWILPLLAFRNPEPKALNGREINMIAVELEVPAGDGAFRVKAGADGNPAVRPLAAEAEYMAVVGRHPNAYHPNEVAAHLLSFLYVEDLDAAAGRGRRPARPGQAGEDDRRQAEFRKWAAEALKDISPSSGQKK